MLLERQSDKENFDLGLVVFDRVVPLVLGKDLFICDLVDDSVSVRVLAILGFDALVPEPFVSVTCEVSTVLHLYQDTMTES